MRWLSVIMTLALVHMGCAHAEQAASRVYLISESAEGLGAGPGTGGASEDRCQRELEQCMRACWEKKQWPYPHSKEQAGWYYKRCTADCNRLFTDCEEELEEAERQQPKRLEFTSMSEALHWIREHKIEVALGALVVVAGVTFVVTTAGTGTLVLVPLVL